MKNFFQKNWWIAVVAILVIAVLVVVLLTAKQNPPANEPTTEATTEASTENTVEATVETTVPQQTEETVDATEETIPVVYVEILNYEFALDQQLAERIFCRELVDTDASDVEVYTKLEDKEYTLFTIIFDSVEGDIVHMLDTAEEEKLPIAFLMNELPEGLSGEAASEFYIAQGTVNDIIGTIKAK